MTIEESIEEINKNILFIKESIQTQDILIRTLIKNRLGNKADKLSEEIKRVGNISVSQAMNYLGITRPHALDIMKKIGKQPGYTFMLGSKYFKSPSRIIYNESLIIKHQLVTILEILNKQNETTLAEIMSSTGMSLDETKYMCSYLVNENNNYLLKENKVIKLN